MAELPACTQTDLRIIHMHSIRHEGTSRTSSGGPARQINQIRASLDECYRSHGRAERRCMRLQPLRFGSIPAYVPMIMAGSAAIVAVHASLWLVLGRSTAEGG